MKRSIYKSCEDADAHSVCQGGGLRFYSADELPDDAGAAGR